VCRSTTSHSNILGNRRVTPINTRIDTRSVARFNLCQISSCDLEAGQIGIADDDEMMALGHIRVNTGCSLPMGRFSCSISGETT
jgi:hypothetical protein